MRISLLKESSNKNTQLYFTFYYNGTLLYGAEGYRIMETERKILNDLKMDAPR